MPEETPSANAETDMTDAQNASENQFIAEYRAKRTRDRSTASQSASGSFDGSRAIHANVPSSAQKLQQIPCLINDQYVGEKSMSTDTTVITPGAGQSVISTDRGHRDDYRGHRDTDDLVLHEMLANYRAQYEATTNNAKDNAVGFKDSQGVAYMVEGRAGVAAAANAAAIQLQASTLGSASVLQSEKLAAASSLQAQVIASESEVQAEKLAAAASLQSEKLAAAAALQSERLAAAAELQAEKLSAASVLQASEHTASIHKHIAECCCETQKLVIATGQNTLNRVNEIEIGRQAVLLSDEKARNAILEARLIACCGGCSPTAAK